MSKKKLDKRISYLEPSFDNILVCSNKRYRPFIEILIQEPENIIQQNLGTLIGVFDVTDKTDDSSYIVNYLISVIKKEYFSKPKRGAVESFEAALHKANLALSAIAEHGNINWIGKLNCLVATVEKNNLHISQAGTASAFLFRGKFLTNLSEGLASEESAANPLKTFTNISSGRIEDQDRLIITTDSIFNIFSLEEIKKSFLRFSEKEFSQFLKTALGNELERAAVLLLGIDKKEVAEPAPSPLKSNLLNAFSQTAFNRSGPAIAVDNQEIKEELEKVKKNSNEKTGHIYIKESDAPLKNAIERKPYDFSQLKKIGNYFKNLWPLFLTSVKAISISILKKIVALYSKINLSGLKKVFSNLPSAKEIPIRKNLPDISTMSRQTFQKAKNLAAFILPNFSRIKQLYKKFTSRQKAYAASLILAIIILPFVGIKISQKIEEKNKQVASSKIQKIIIPLEQDKNVLRVEQLNQAYSQSGLDKLINLNGKLFGIGQNKIIDLEKGEISIVPQDFGAIKNSTGMDDLNLIILTNRAGKAYAFSPNTKKFQENQISFPNSSAIASTGTFLTYLYALDNDKSQIYRFPRAEGGFGEKTNWLKENVDLGKSTYMAVNENIFVVSENSVLKFFRGKKQDFNIEQTATVIAPDKLFVIDGSENLYILDKKNSRIIKSNGSGSIINQYYNPEIANASDFTINETTNTIYISTPQIIYSFPTN